MVDNFTQVILVSVLDAEDDILRALEAGANDYLVKPCSSALVSATRCVSPPDKVRDVRSNER